LRSLLTSTVHSSDDESKKKSSKSKSKSKSSSRHKSSYKRSSRKRYSSDSDSDSDSDRDRSSSRRHKSSSSSRHKSSSSRHKSSSSRRDRDRSDDDDDDKDRRRKKRPLSVLSEGEEGGERSSKRRERDPSQALVPAPIAEEDEWVEKEGAVDPSVLAAAAAGADDSDSDDVGPMPLSGPGAPSSRGGAAYGGAMRPGEGSAIAAYVQDGARIPRRGEIGMDAEKIEKYEMQGYVMSGSRHKKMNAVRVRKENQVISAEEKRGTSRLSPVLPLSLPSFPVFERPSASSSNRY
jgi:hypothetical protein